MNLKPRRLIFMLYVLFTILLVLTLEDVARIDINSFWESSARKIEDGWTLSIDGEVKDQHVILPAIIDEPEIPNQVLVLSRKISRVQPYESSIMFRTSQKMVDVYLDGEKIYTYDGSLDTRKTVLLGYINHVLRLPSDVDGKLLEIHMVSNQNDNGFILYDVFIGSRTSQIIELLRYDGLSLFFGLLIIITAVVVLIFTLTFFRKLEIRSNGFAFAGIEFCAGLWMVSGSMSTQILIHNQVVLLVAAMFSLYMLPVFVTWFVKSMYKIPEGPILLVFVQIFPFAFVLASALQLNGVGNYSLWFTPVTVVLLLYFIVLIAISIRDYIRGNRPILRFLIAFSCLFFAIVGEFILLILPLPNLLNALILNLGIFAFGAILLHQILCRVMRYIAQRGRDEYLLSLVHTDGLTGIPNRRAFDERMDVLRSRAYFIPIGLVVFDVNNLKEMNDKAGHNAGDDLLRSIAKELSGGFKGVGTVYRIGGDEFAMICEPCDEQAYAQRKHVLLSYDSRLGDVRTMYSLAYGEALWKHPEEFNSIDDIFAEADRRMYAHKKQMKKRVREQLVSS